MMAARQRVVIIGATSCIAEHCARLWLAQQPAEMILVGRNAAKTERVAQDLRVRCPEAQVRACTADFIDPIAIQAFVDGLFVDAPVDVALIAHGLLPSQEACQRDLGLCREALLVNGISPALFAEAFAGGMERTGGGRLAIMGSVAGDRGRQSNYIYGAAKGLLIRYAQGLQHRFAGTGVSVTIVLPGPTATPMTADLQALKGASRLADPGAVASHMVRAIQQRRPTCYAPGYWAFIMFVLRHLPRAVFNRMRI